MCVCTKYVAINRTGYKYECCQTSPANFYRPGPSILAFSLFFGYNVTVVIKENNCYTIFLFILTAFLAKGQQMSTQETAVQPQAAASYSIWQLVRYFLSAG